MNPFQLNLRHLRGLLEICEVGSVSAASEKLNISQPALTQGVVKLEAQLGHVLFERRSNGMIPTEIGRIVAHRVELAFEHLKGGVKALNIPAFRVDRRLNMTQIRAFLAVIQAGSIAAASVKIELSQPAVHRAVRELEDVLQRSLIERHGRGVTVNFAGKRFSRSCRLAVGELQSAFADIGLDAQRKTLAVGTTPLARAYLVPEAMATALLDDPRIGFQVSEGNWGDLVELLRDGLIDVIVGELPEHDSPDLIKTHLSDESAIVVAGRQHPLANSDQVVDENVLAKFPWIVPPDNSPLKEQWKEIFSQKEPTNTPIQCGSIMIIGRLLTSSNLLTIATPDQVALQIRSGLLVKIRSAHDAQKHPIGMTVRQKWKPTEQQKKFLSALEKVSVTNRNPSGSAGIQAQWNT